MTARGRWRAFVRVVTKQPLVTTVIGGVVVLVAQGVWDWYRESRALTLTYQNSAVLADSAHAPDSLRFLYGRDTIPGLTRLSFLLANTGRRSIVSEEISVPPFVSVDNGTILLARLEERVPAEISVGLQVDSSRSRASLIVPLLNPGDKFAFALYVPQSAAPRISFGIHARGMTHLSFVDARPGQERRGWFSPSVAIFLGGEAYLLLNLGVLLMTIGYERRARKTWTGGALKLRPGVTVAQFAATVRSLFPEHPGLISFVEQNVAVVPAEATLPVDLWRALSDEVSRYADDLRHKLTNAALVNLFFMLTVALYFVWVTR